MKIKTNTQTGRTTIEFSSAELMGLHEEMNQVVSLPAHQPAIQEFVTKVAEHMDEDH